MSGFFAAMMGASRLTSVAELTAEALPAIEATTAGLFVGALLFQAIIGALYMSFEDQTRTYLSEEL